LERNCHPNSERIYDLNAVKVPSSPFLNPSEPSSAASKCRQKNLDTPLSFRQQHAPMSHAPFRFVRDDQELKEQLFRSSRSAVHAAAATKL
jgi:hypothetical protein